MLFVCSAKPTDLKNAICYNAIYQMEDDMTKAMRRALEKAANRERGNICPIPGVWANAEQMLIEAMDRRGYIAWDDPEGHTLNGGSYIHHGAPRISEAGRRALGG